MNVLLSTDTLLSVLAGLALLALRSALNEAQLAPRLAQTLRFGALVLGLFYLLRPLAWHADGSFADRIILVLAVLVPLAILLIIEAAVTRHAPRPLKLGLAVGVPLLILGALVMPRSLGALYLAVLLGFQIMVLLFSCWMLWHESAGMETAERRSRRLFAVLTVLILPVVAAESALLNDGNALHGSALVVLFGVWMLFHLPRWATRRWWLIVWSMGGLGLSFVTAWAIVPPDGSGSLLLATTGITAMLVFASIFSSLLGQRRGTLERQLVALVGRPSQQFGLEHVLEKLSDRQVAMVPANIVSNVDVPPVRDALRRGPVWFGQSDTGRDADAALADVARATGASHVLCVGTEPLRLMTLSLGPADGGRHVVPLLTALCRRLEQQDPK